MILNNILIDLITLRTSPCAEGLNGLVLFGYHFERFHAFAVFRHDYIVHAFGCIYCERADFAGHSLMFFGSYLTTLCVEDVDNVVTVGCELQVDIFDEGVWVYRVFIFDVALFTRRWENYDILFFRLRIRAPAVGKRQGDVIFTVFVECNRCVVTGVLNFGVGNGECRCRSDGQCTRHGRVTLNSDIGR